MIFSIVAKPFTVGNGSVGLGTGDVVAALSNPAPLPSIATQFWTLGLTFPNNNFSSGKILRFTVGRGEQHSAAVGTFAVPIGGPPFAGPNSGASTTNPNGDLFGGGVLIPEGIVTNSGMSFSGTLSDASTFSGVFRNRIGPAIRFSMATALLMRKQLLVSRFSKSASEANFSRRRPVMACRLLCWVISTAGLS
jgi:hypothetical protein